MEKILFGPISVKSFLLTTIIVGIITGYNVYMNPVTEVTDQGSTEVWFYEYIEDLDWSSVEAFGMDVWIPSGMIVEEVSSNRVVEMEGVLHGFGDPNTVSGEFYLIAFPASEFVDWEQVHMVVEDLSGREFVFNETSLEIDSDFTSWQGHRFLMSLLKGNRKQEETFIGLIQGQICDQRDLVVVYVYFDYDGFDVNDYVYNGAVYAATYRCHLVEGTPLDKIIGYPYEKKQEN